MRIDLGADDFQMLIAAAFGLAGLVSLARWRGGAAAPAMPGSAWQPRDILLLAVALASAGNYFLLGRHPTQFVKSWDVQHTWFGSKYARELGYFRIYECLYAFDAQAQGVYRNVRVLSDLHTPHGRLAAAEAAARTDCAARFSPERRASFLRDLDFFQRLPDRPQSAAWFRDNGYNQSPVFTALTAPLFQRLPLRYDVLVGLTLVDVALETLPFALVWSAFGARTAALAAIFFFTSFSNQFAAMGGSILRFGYLALLLVAACAARRSRPRAAGVALAAATLLQVFPAFYAVGFAAAAGLRRLRGRSLPPWAAPGAAAYAATLAAGFVASLPLVGLEAWREFAAKMALHGSMLSEYRVGLKLPFVLDWPIAAGGALPYLRKLAELDDLRALHLACAAALVLAVSALVSKLRPLEFAILFGTVVLYIATPVHYYFSTLVLLFFVGADEPLEAASALGRCLLFWLSAGAFAIANLSGSLALVNNYWLSLGILVMLVAWLAALHVGRRPLETQLLE